MPAPALQRLDLTAFLALAAAREGKWELFDGVAVEMSQENARQAEIKLAAVIALRESIRATEAQCQAFVGGMVVPVSNSGAFLPDALVVCPPPPRDAIVIDNPLIVVEVLSPSTAAVDHGIKLEGYFSLPSLAHYLILDPERRVVIHHKPGQGGVIETRILREGAMPLEPPGLDLQVADLFGPEEAGS